MLRDPRKREVRGLMAAPEPVGTRVCGWTWPRKGARGWTLRKAPGLTRSDRFDAHLPADQLPGQQGWPVGHDFLGLGPSASEARDTRRTGGDERGDLSPEAL